MLFSKLFKKWSNAHIIFETNSEVLLTYKKHTNQTPLSVLDLIYTKMKNEPVQPDQLLYNFFKFNQVFQAVSIKVRKLEKELIRLYIGKNQRPKIPYKFPLFCPPSISIYPPCLTQEAEIQRNGMAFRSFHFHSHLQHK